MDFVAEEILSFFSSDYQSSRENFLAAAYAQGAQIHSYKFFKRGPQGESLFMDTATLGSKSAKAVIFLSSGTHGVEGFAGNAIQVGLLRSGIKRQLGNNTRLVLIHAINPYGVAYLRRVNEDNVDLNRNFMDHTKIYPVNRGYEAMSEAIAPLSCSLVSHLAGMARLFMSLFRSGIRATKASISSGQFTHPRGLFYGGVSQAWSTRTLLKVVRQHAHGAKKVIFIDVHTGLGPFAQGEVILNVPKKSPSYQRAVKWWGDKVKTTKADEAVSSDLKGSLKLSIPKLLRFCEVTAVSLEFGTVSPLRVFRALRAENWQHFQTKINGADRDKIKKHFLNTFYPKSVDWRISIWNQGEEVICKLLNNLIRK